MTSLSRQVGGREIADTKTMAIQELTHQYEWIFRSNSDIPIPPRTLKMGTLNLQKKHLAKKVKWIWAPFVSEFYASGRITPPILDTQGTGNPSTKNL